jgi:GGDEF domain-containing protein
MLSKAIETNKQRELTYVRQATIDALTGCKNRRAFDSDIAALMNDHQPFALALVDIDNFKSINDTWGHLNGDIVLRNVAREGLQVLQPLEISSIATAAKSSRWSFLPNILITPARCWKHGG